MSDDERVAELMQLVPRGGRWAAPPPVEANIELSNALDDGRPIRVSKVLKRLFDPGYSSVHSRRGRVWLGSPLPFYFNLHGGASPANEVGPLTPLAARMLSLTFLFFAVILGAAVIALGIFVVPSAPGVQALALLLIALLPTLFLFWLSRITFPHFVRTGFRTSLDRDGQPLTLVLIRGRLGGCARFRVPDSPSVYVTPEVEFLFERGW